MDPIRDSLENPLVLVIRPTRAQAWPQAKLILDTIADAAPFSAEPKVYYFVVKPNRELFAKALALIELLGHTKAVQIYANGRLNRARWEITRIGDCYLKATRCANSQLYCHVVHEHEERRYPSAGIAITMRIKLDGEPEVENDREEPRDESRMVRRLLVPCRYLYDREHHRVTSQSLDADGFAAIAVEHGVDICPLFNSRAYAELFPKMIGRDGRVES